MEHPRNPNAPCPPRNPHCHDPVGVSIQSELLTTLLIIAGILLVLHALKIINMKKIFKSTNSLFERFYDYMSNLIGGGKSFAPAELKGFRYNNQSSFR